MSPDKILTANPLFFTADVKGEVMVLKYEKSEERGSRHWII